MSRTKIGLGRIEKGFRTSKKFQSTVECRTNTEAFNWKDLNNETKILSEISMVNKKLD